MDSIEDRQVTVGEFLLGDATHLLTIYWHYKYIADITWRYNYARLTIQNVAKREIAQQSHFELLNILRRRVCGTEKMGLAIINREEGYEPCLGLRPFLITSIRQMLRQFVIEQTRVIRIHKVIYEKAYIEEHGEPNPVRAISNVSYTEDGEEYPRPGAIPIDYITPYDIVVAREILDGLNLTSVEKKILEMRHCGWSLEDIGSIIGKDKATISRKLSAIQAKWKRKNGA